jgi:cyclopropane-fatty-acyl-phospholipid synthase
MSEASEAWPAAGEERRLPSAFRAVVRLLAQQWRTGELVLVSPHGEAIRLRGDQEGPQARLELKSYRAVRRLVRGGSIGFAEGFMAGDWDTPDLSALLHAVALNLDRVHALIRGQPLVRGALHLLHRMKANTRAGARRNIAAHYDLGNDFYRLWLDASMTYSSARFEDEETLEAAQARKYAALCRLMALEQGQEVLEIGCGWGGFAEHAAGVEGAKVTGITISAEQLAFAKARIADKGLAERVELRFEDYRDTTGRFDRIASIEMFEAVGEAYWPAYFAKVRDLLRTGGRAGLQIITIREDIFESYRRRADFIQRYIFPGGMLPSETRLKAEIARAGLLVQAVERFPLDYARTLRLWRERFEAVRAQVAALGFDERFQRMWRYYLAYCEAGFRTGRIGVGQWVVARA